VSAGLDGLVTHVDAWLARKNPQRTRSFPVLCYGVRDSATCAILKEDGCAGAIVDRLGSVLDGLGRGLRLKGSRKLEEFDTLPMERLDVEVELNEIEGRFQKA
jgi:hypothetical protein